LRSLPPRAGNKVTRETAPGEAYLPGGRQAPKNLFLPVTISCFIFWSFSCLRGTKSGVYAGQVKPEYFIKQGVKFLKNLFFFALC